MNNYSELVKALRHCSHDGIVKCNECKYDGKEWPVGCEEEMMRDAAAAIEDLQAQLMYATDAAKEIAEKVPKRSQWTNLRISVDGTSSVECILCGATIHNGFTKEPNYCPNCGAKMEVQDA